MYSFCKLKFKKIQLNPFTQSCICQLPEKEEQLKTGRWGTTGKLTEMAESWRVNSRTFCLRICIRCLPTLSIQYKVPSSLGVATGPVVAHARSPDFRVAALSCVVPCPSAPPMTLHAPCHRDASDSEYREEEGRPPRIWTRRGH